MRKYAYASIKKCENILSGMFKTAIRWQMIELNPCTNAIIPKTTKRTDDKLKYFTPQESLIFLRSLDKPYTSTYKGYYRIDDTGKRYYVDDYTETKKVASKRIVPMPDEVISLLKKYKSEYLCLKISMGDAWHGENNLFVQSDGKLMGRSTPYQYFKKHLKRYNEWIANNAEEAQKQGYEKLPIIPLHGLRHSCATLLNYLGTNIVDIAKVLGHSQTSTTMNTYAHSFDSQNYSICDKMNEFLKMNA